MTEAPFIATYVHKVSKQATPQHLPLGQALKEYAGAKNRQKLLALLSPLARAAEKSDFIRELGPLIFDFFKKSLVIWGHRGLERCAVRTASPSRGSRRLFSST